MIADNRRESRLKIIPLEKSKIALLYLAAILMVFNGFFFNSNISNYILIASLFIGIALNCYQGYPSKTLILSAFGIVLAFLSIKANHSGYGSLIIYANIVLYLSAFANIRITEAQKRTVLRIAMVALVVVMMVFFKQDKMNTYYYSIMPGITAEKINPNTMAMMYLFFYFFACMELRGLPYKKTCYIISFALFAVFFYLIYLTHARTSLLALVVAFILNTVLWGRHAVPKLKFVFLALFLCTLLCVFAYLLFYKIVGEGFKILGKSLFSGREIVWTEALSIIKNHLFFGYDSSFAFSEGRYLSAHNSLLGVLFVFGIIPTAILIAVFYRSFAVTATKKTSMVAINAIFSTMILMCFETVLTDVNFYFFFALLFLAGRVFPTDQTCLWNKAPNFCEKRNKDIKSWLIDFLAVRER